VYAIVRTGGKQYRVAAGDTIYVERLEAPVGEKITLDDVLLVGGDSVTVGSPRVAGATVVGTVVPDARAPAVLHGAPDRGGPGVLNGRGGDLGVISGGPRGPLPSF